MSAPSLWDLVNSCMERTSVLDFFLVCVVLSVEEAPGGRTTAVSDEAAAADDVMPTTEQLALLDATLTATIAALQIEVKGNNCG